MHVAAQTGMMPAGAAQMAAAGAQAAAQPRLVKAAHEFEAQLMQELMKPLTRGGAPGCENGDGDGDADSDDDGGLGSAGALGEFASESMARAMSEHGGFGIANQIIAQLSRRSNADSSRLGNESEQGREIGKEHLRSKIKNPK